MFSINQFSCLICGLDESYEDSITMATMRTCLDVATMAASMVVAGSGRIDFLRTLRKLHKRIKGDTNYGSHMAYHMALGFLFLGGGSCTLGTTNRCVAALLCSLYPRLPLDPMDNRGHLQAFRHLWVLAVEPRCLVTREASTGAYCPVPVTVHLKPTLHQTQSQPGEGQHAMLVPDEPDIPLSLESEYTGLNPNVTLDMARTPYSTSKLSMMTPCLLPELSTISKIEIKGARYWPITLDFNNEKEDYAQMWRILKSGSIVVMRRIGHLSYSEDHSGMRGILARPFPKVLTGEGMEGDCVEESGGPRREKRNKLERLVEMRRQRTLGKKFSLASAETFSKAAGSFASGAGRSTDGGGRFLLQDTIDIGALKDELEPDSALFGQDFSLTLLKDPQVASFAKYLCRLRPTVESDDAEDLVKEELRASYFTSVLYECLTMDKVEMLGAHVWLYDIANRLEDLGEISWRSLWELRILKQYYEMQMGRRLLETQDRRGAGGGGNPGHRTAGSRGVGSGDSGIRMIEDDGSQTLVKISRVTELYSEVTKRVDQAMKVPIEDEGARYMERTVEEDAGEDLWKTTRGKARHYFANGTFPSFTENGARDGSVGRKKRESGIKSYLRGYGQQQQQQRQDDEEEDEEEEKEAEVEDEVMSRKKKAVKTDWFKVWLELNRIPGPDQIRSMKRALEHTVDQWRPLLRQGDGSASDGTGREMNDLLAQVFSLAYPRVSLKVLEYLLLDHQD